MLRRREAIIRIGCGALLPGLLGAQRPAVSHGSDDRAPSTLPEITSPILFNTPEADRILEELKVFPANNPWNADIFDWPLHPNSRKLVASIGPDKPLRYNSDMSFVLVPPDQRRVRVKIASPEESDPGPFPVPDNMPIEGWPASYKRGEPGLRKLTLEDAQRGQGGDRHAIVVDPVNRMLYEFYQARKTDAGWQARYAAAFDLKSNKMRPETWTSTDAAGLPVFPALVRYDELQRGSINHALRVTISRTAPGLCLPGPSLRQSEPRSQPSAHGRTYSITAGL